MVAEDAAVLLHVDAGKRDALFRYADCGGVVTNFFRVFVVINIMCVDGIFGIVGRWIGWRSRADRGMRAAAESSCRKEKLVSEPLVSERARTSA